MIYHKKNERGRLEEWEERGEVGATEGIVPWIMIESLPPLIDKV